MTRNTDFKDTPLFNVEHLRNDARYMRITDYHWKVLCGLLNRSIASDLDRYSRSFQLFF